MQMAYPIDIVLRRVYVDPHSTTRIVATAMPIGYTHTWIYIKLEDPIIGEILQGMTNQPQNMPRARDFIKTF